MKDTFLLLGLLNRQRKQLIKRVLGRCKHFFSWLLRLVLAITVHVKQVKIEGRLLLRLSVRLVFKVVKVYFKLRRSFLS